MQQPQTVYKSIFPLILFCQVGFAVSQTSFELLQRTLPFSWMQQRFETQIFTDGEQLLSKGKATVDLGIFSLGALATKDFNANLSKRDILGVEISRSFFHKEGTFGHLEAGWLKLTNEKENGFFLGIGAQKSDSAERDWVLLTKISLYSSAVVAKNNAVLDIGLRRQFLRKMYLGLETTAHFAIKSPDSDFLLWTLNPNIFWAFSNFSMQMSFPLRLQVTRYGSDLMSYSTERLPMAVEFSMAVSIPEAL